ncbi:MAG: hypothetical protein AB7O50_16470 [Pseudolabrys sp.]
MTRTVTEGCPVNPATGLATDYLNHFNEAIMLLDMLTQCPDFLDDFLAWTPMTYREHFAASRLKDREAMIAAYEQAEPDARRQLDALACAMTTMLEATRIALRSGLTADEAAKLARHIVTMLKPLVARAGAAINGAPDQAAGDATPQAAIDRLMIA